MRLLKVSVAGALFRFPFERQPLAFLNLSLGHFSGDLIPISFCDLVTLRGGQVEPHVRADIVVWDTTAVGVHEPETGLSFGIALFRRPEIPAHRSRIVLLTPRRWRT